MRIDRSHRVVPFLRGLASTALLAAGLLTGASSAQVLLEQTTPLASASKQEVVPGQYIVHFKSRSFDLSQLRMAARSEATTTAEYQKIVDSIAAKNAKERQAFGLRVEKLGGRVIENFWIINASSVAISSEKLAELRAIPGVDRIQPDYVFYPTLSTATNRFNHNSDTANTMLTTTKARIEGTGITAAILDTGVDIQMGSSGRPHRLYYQGGTTSGRNRLLGAVDVVFNGSGDDVHGHGTMVSHCVGGAKWASDSRVDNGIAPNCDFYGIKVAVNSSGSSSSTYLTRAWQRVLSDRKAKNIKVANNSYSGSPAPHSSTQQALDSAAFNGDVFITVPSGNSGTRISATQAGFNGINVGATNNGSRSLASFSGRGTTSYGKVIPDMVAVGANLYMAVRDRESSITRASGTSFSSPIVAGAGCLVRQINPKFTALETKAILINSTEANSNGTGKGAGYMRADLASQEGLATDVFRAKVTSSQRKNVHSFSAKQGVRHAVTVTWFRSRFNTSASDDLNLTIYDSSNKVVASSSMRAGNSYEKAVFTPASSGVYRAEVNAASLVVSSVEYAIAGVGQPIPPKPPVLSSIKPSQVQVFEGGDVVLTGQNLSAVTEVQVGTLKVAPKSVTNTTVTFIAPTPTALGTVAVLVRNAGGASGSVQMTYVPVNPAKLSATTALFTLVTVTDTLWTEPGTIGVNFISGSNSPTKIPGVLSLGIGNGFKDLVLFGVMVSDKIGRSRMTWTPPFGFASKSFFQQVVILHTPTAKIPFPVSNSLKRTVIF